MAIFTYIANSHLIDSIEIVVVGSGGGGRLASDGGGGVDTMRVGVELDDNLENEQANNLVTYVTTQRKRRSNTS